MLASLRRAVSRALALVMAAAVISGCGGGDPTSPSSDRPSATTVSSTDGARVSYLAPAKGNQRQPTVRVSRDASGAQTLPARLTPVGPIYQFSPLGMLAAGIEIRVPFDRTAVPEGHHPRLFISSPGEPWAEVAGATVDGDAMVGRVPRFSHAVVALSSAAEERSGARRLSVGTAGVPLTVSIDAATTSPALPAPTSDGWIMVRQPTHVAVVATYALPVECTGDARLMLIGVDGGTDSVAVLAMEELRNRSGSVTATYAISPGAHGWHGFFAILGCGGSAVAPALYYVGSDGALLDVDVPGAGLPVITRSPATASATEGEEVNFFVSASDGRLTYLWQKSSDGGTSYSAVGSDWPILSFPATIADNDTLWRVVVSNDVGSVTSNPARLSVAGVAVAPAITADPVSQTVMAGETASFTVLGQGTPTPAVQWQRRSAGSPDPDSGWSDIEGATSLTYTTAPTALSNNGEQYRAILRNSGGTATSLMATLTVQERMAAPAILAGPQAQSVSAQQYGAFTVTVTGTSPLNYQWFKNGAPIMGATGPDVLVYADPADVGGNYQISVQISNAAGSVTSPAVAMTINTTQGGSTGGTAIDAAAGGVAEAPGDISLVVPPGALLMNTMVTIKTESSGTVTLPDGFSAMGDVVAIGPSDLIFSTPAAFSLPAPESLPAGTVLALVNLPSDTSAIQSAAGAAAARAVPAVNVRRVAAGMTRAGRRAVAAAVNPTSVQCLDSQNMRSGYSVVGLDRAARFVTAAVPESACTGTAAAPYKKIIPSNTTIPCRDNEFVNEGTGQSTLLSRHVHCGRNETDLGWISDATGDYGRFKLAWRISSDGAPKLTKNFRVKLQLTRTELPTGKAAPSALRLAVEPRFECSSQQYSGSCTHSKVTGSVTAGQGWSSEILVPITFDWSGGSDTWNEFIFQQIFLAYKIQGAGEENGIYLSYAPKVRCDKQMAVNGGSGCVYPDAPAVLVMSAGDARVKEAAEHIRAAQSWGARGALAFDSEGRALASVSNALQRTRVASLKQANRNNACGFADAVINLRPQSTATCSQAPSTCECDEYPFASTWNGGWLNKDGTSARWVQAAHNRESGSRLQRFYQSERLLDFTAANSAYDTSRLGGDDFWVHIE